MKIHNVIYEYTCYNRAQGHNGDSEFSHTSVETRLYRVLTPAPDNQVQEWMKRVEYEISDGGGLRTDKAFRILSHTVEKDDINMILHGPSYAV